MKPDFYCENNVNVDAKVWKKKARGFAVRARDHLWRSNNEDPLTFLYLKGLNLDFIGKMALGWNKFGHTRPCDGWGLSGTGSFFIPCGIVFPYIVEKEITGLFIISMANPDSDSGSEVIIPGSFKGPLILGPGNGDIKETTGILDGLRIYQESQDLFSVKISLPQR